MHCVRRITEDLLYLGASDRRLALFENAFPVPKGISYNAYIILDEKTALLDTVDAAVSERFFENLAFALAGRPLDYLVVNHMEPDHCATMEALLLRYPQVRLVCNSKSLAMVKQFFDFEADSRCILVQEGDSLPLGRHTLRFFMAPMVHWPEVMATYDELDKALFSADAFGSFGAIEGNLFADEVDYPGHWLPEARRYYANIVGKYGAQVTALLKKVQALDIRLLCPLHGLVWRRDIPCFINKYAAWAAYAPEETGLLVAYASVYGHTQNAAEILAARLGERGVRNIAMYDVSVTHPSYILAEAFRFSHLLLGAATYNGGIFPAMETLLLDMKAHNLQNRCVALIENGSWAPSSGRQMAAILGSMKGMDLVGSPLTLKSALKQQQEAELEALGDAILATIPKAL